MNRILWVGLFLTATVLLGCQGEEGGLPSAPGDDLRPAAVDPNEESIREAIQACTSGGTENSYVKRLGNIARKLDPQHLQLEVAQGMADELIADFLAEFGEGGSAFGCSPTETTEIVVALLTFVQNPLAAEDEANLAAALAAGDRGAAQVCDLSVGCTVVPANSCRGIDIPPQLDETGNHLVTVFPIDENPFVGVFPGYNSYPLWADVSIAGVESFNPAAVVGVFVVEPPDPDAPPNATVEARLRMGHKIFNETEERFEVEVLTLVDAPFIGCEAGDVALQENWQGWLAASPVGRLFQVTPLYANPGKLGGAILSASPIGAVDPDSDTETALVLDDDALADGEAVTATADVTVVTLGAPPLATESPTVDFVVDEGTDGAQTFTEPLDVNGEAELVLTCDAGEIFVGSLALAQATGTIDEGTHTIVARYTGTDSSAPSESGVETVECGGVFDGPS